MTDTYDEQIEVMARAMQRAEATRNAWPGERGLWDALARAAAEAIGLREGCVIVPRDALAATRDELYEIANSAGDPWGTPSGLAPIVMSVNDYIHTLPGIEKRACAAAEKIETLIAASPT